MLVAHMNELLIWKKIKLCIILFDVIPRYQVAEYICSHCLSYEFSISDKSIQIVVQ